MSRPTWSESAISGTPASRSGSSTTPRDWSTGLRSRNVRLMKCQQRVRGRGETELAAVLQSLPLRVKVEAKRSGAAFDGDQLGAAGQHETESGRLRWTYADETRKSAWTAAKSMGIAP